MGLQNGVTTMLNIMEAPQKIKNRNAIQSSNLTSGYISRRTEAGYQELFAKVHQCWVM